MNRLSLIRAAILGALSPLVGLGITVYLAVTDRFHAYDVPLIIALVFGPVLARDRLPEIGERLVRIGRALGGDDDE